MELMENIKVSKVNLQNIFYKVMIHMRAGTNRIKCFQDQIGSLPFTHWGTAFITGQLTDMSDHHSISSCDTNWEIDPNSEDTT